MVCAREKGERAWQFDSTGKLVLVTGGSAGIGAEISMGIVAEVDT